MKLIVLLLCYFDCTVHLHWHCAYAPLQPCSLIMASCMLDKLEHKRNPLISAWGQLNQAVVVSAPASHSKQTHLPFHKAVNLALISSSNIAVIWPTATKNTSKLLNSNVKRCKRLVTWSRLVGPWYQRGWLTIYGRLPQKNNIWRTATKNTGKLLNSTEENVQAVSDLE